MDRERFALRVEVCVCIGCLYDFLCVCGFVEDIANIGNRALAAAWDKSSYNSASAFPTPLKSISLFVLLDLLGAADPNIPSYFASTHWAYKHLAKVEERLRAQGLLESTPKAAFMRESDRDETDMARFFRGYVQDDHVPFMRRGVEVLHVIPSPFPAVWHTMDDDGAHLDLPTTRDWAKIMAAFVAEWMDLDGFLPELEAPILPKGKRLGDKDEL